jgi:uncharacterized protein
VKKKNVARKDTVKAGGGADFPYFTFSRYLREQFGTSVRKIPLDAGFSCPNRDGRLGTEGCVFCDAEGGTGRRNQAGVSVWDQLRRALEFRGVCHPDQKYLAYFQSFTNTDASVAKLRKLYESVLGDPRVAGLVVSTRPDCLPDAVVDLLKELAGRTWVSVEMGVQSMRDVTLGRIGRGHDSKAVRDAVIRCREAGLFVCAHVILGLPGETLEDWVYTARELGMLSVDAVKLHMLYVVENSPLARLFTKGEIRLLERDEYVRGAVAFLQNLPEGTVIERLVSDPPRDRFLGPQWLLDKHGILADIRSGLEATTS